MSTRRRSVARITFLSTPGLLYGLVLVIALGLSGLAASQSWNAWRLQSGGVTALARLVRRETGTHRCGSRRHRRTCRDYTLTYSFRTTMGERTVERSVNQGEYDRTRMGAGRQIRYLPGAPSVTEATPGGAWRGATGTGVLAAMVAGAGGLAFSRLHRRARRMALVRDTGVERSATVTGHRDTTVRVNGAALWVVQWQDEAGARGEGLARFASFLPAIGTQITVYADPGGALPSAWAGDTGPPWPAAKCEQKVNAPA